MRMQHLRGKNSKLSKEAHIGSKDKTVFKKLKSAKKMQSLKKKEVMLITMMLTMIIIVFFIYHHLRVLI